MIRLGDRALRRWSAAARLTAAIGGAYGFTTLFTVTLSLVLVRLGMTKVEAATAATLASFAVFTLMALVAYHARSAGRAWAWLIGPAVPLAALLWLVLPGGTP